MQSCDLVPAGRARELSHADERTCLRSRDPLNPPQRNLYGADLTLDVCASPCTTCDRSIHTAHRVGQQGKELVVKVIYLGALIVAQIPQLY